MGAKVKVPKIARNVRLERAIYRIDHERHLVHGWLVKMNRRSVLYRKLFSDSVWHGRDGALAAARAYRDSVLAALAPKAVAASQSAEMKQATAIAGIDRYCTEDTHHLEETSRHWFWRATWTTSQGQAQHAVFSVREYGDEVAFRMALQARRAGVGGVRGMMASIAQHLTAARPDVFDPGPSVVPTERFASECHGGSPSLEASACHVQESGMVRA